MLIFKQDNSKTGHAQKKRCSLNQINQRINENLSSGHMYILTWRLTDRWIYSQKKNPQKMREKKKNLLASGFLRFDAIRLPYSFKIPFNPFVWLCKHSIKLNSTKPNETKRNPKKGLPCLGEERVREEERDSERGASKTNMRNPFFCAKKRKKQQEIAKQSAGKKSWKVEKYFRTGNSQLSYPHVSG